MSSLFGGTPQPMAQKVPVSPVASGEAERVRAAAADAAIAAGKSSGRQSTVYAGAQIAADAQYGRGLLAMKKRSESARSLGFDEA